MFGKNKKEEIKEVKTEEQINIERNQYYSNLYKDAKFGEWDHKVIQDNGEPVLVWFDAKSGEECFREDIELENWFPHDKEVYEANLKKEEKNELIANILTGV